jgi:two-component system, cell cycle response regulator
LGGPEDDWEDEGHTLITGGAGLLALLNESERNNASLLLLSGPDVGRSFQLGPGEVVLGRAPSATIRLMDVSVSRKHARLLVRGADVIVEDLNSSNGSFLNGERLKTPTKVRDGDKLRFGDTTVLKFTFNDSLDDEFQKRMYDAALRDGLTGAYNKRFFNEQLRKELRFALRHNTHVSLLMLDLDHFKQVNDTHGHLAGDAVLVQLTELAIDLVRAEDVFARYGGEEFAVVARGISLADTAVLAERLRSAVEAHVFATGEQRLRMTVSIGLTISTPEDSEPEQLIARADAALYKAKGGGRNRVVIAG